MDGIAASVAAGAVGPGRAMSAHRFDWRISGALFVIAAGMLASGLAWPRLALAPRRARTTEQAGELLEQAKRLEASWLRANGRYRPIVAGAVLGAPAGAPAIAPELTDSFSLDAQIGRDGVLHLRVVTRPDPIRSGLLVPMFVEAELPAAPKAATSGDGAAR